MGDKSALSEIIIGYVSRLLNSQSWLITRVVKLQIRMSPSRKYNCFLNDYLHLLSVSLFYAGKYFVWPKEVSEFNDTESAWHSS